MHLFHSRGRRARSLLQTLLERGLLLRSRTTRLRSVAVLLGAATSAWLYSRPSRDPPFRSSSSWHVASNHQSEHSTPVRVILLRFFLSPWHCPLARQYLSDETERGGACRPTQQSPKPPPLLARPSTRDPGSPSNPSSCRGQSRP